MHDSVDHIQRLRTLPAEARPPYNWQEFQRRSEAARPATDWRPLAAAAALLLFVCAIAVWGRFGAGRHVVADSGAVEDGVQRLGADADLGPGAARHSLAHANDTGAWQTREDGAATDHSGRMQSDRAVDGSLETPTNLAADQSGSHDSMLAGTALGESGMAARRSRAIESWLAALPKEPAVVRVGTRAAVAGLEDRIAQVDDLMTSLRIDGERPDRVADLQRERLRLVGSLAQVRYAEVVASLSP
jgi:hypothetical protein